MLSDISEWVRSGCHWCCYAGLLASFEPQKPNSRVTVPVY